MMRFKIRLVLFWFAALLGLAIPVQIAYGLGVTPTRFEFTASPGEEITEAIHIMNTSNLPIHIKGTLLDFRQTDNGEIVVGAEGDTISSARSWVRFTPKEFKLSPQDRTFIRFTVSVPKEVEGEYWTVLRLEELPQVQPDRSAVLLGVRLNIPIYVLIRGTERPRCTIEKIRVAVPDVPATEKFDYPLGVSVQVKNDGNVHLRPKGHLVVREKGTKKVIYSQALVNDDPLFPGNSMELKTGLVEWRLKLTGDYEAAITLNYFDAFHEVEAKHNFKVLPHGVVEEEEEEGEIKIK